MCARARSDPQLLGYFLDNELRWGWQADWRGAQSLLLSYLGLPQTQAGFLTARQFLQDKHGSLAAIGL